MTDIKIPQDTSGSTAQQWKRFVYDYFHAKPQKTSQRNFQIIEYRYGLSGDDAMTLEDIGIIVDLTRERVRQIEKKSLKAFSEIVHTGNGGKKGISYDAGLLNALSDFKAALQSLGDVFLPSEAHSVMVSELGECDQQNPYMSLLLNVYGYEDHMMTDGIGEKRVMWLSRNVNKTRLEDALVTVNRFIRDAIVAQAFYEIKLGVNRSRKSEKRLSHEEITLALHLVDDVEVAGDKYQLIFSRLRTVDDKAYRILHESGKPLHLTTMVSEFNHRERISGGTHTINSHAIGARMSADERFVPMGRSGYWGLKDWNIRTESIVELMIEALEIAFEPLSSDEVYAFVEERREVSRHSVDIYLSTEKRFVRVEGGLYGLKEWGLEEAAKVTRRRSRQMSASDKSEVVAQIFEDEEVDDMYLADLASEFARRFPDRNEHGAYYAIQNLPVVNIRRIDEGNRTRVVAEYVPNYLEHISPDEMLYFKGGVMKTTEDHIRGLLKEAVDNTLSLKTVRDIVSDELDVPPATVYSVVDAMADVKKTRLSDGSVDITLIIPPRQLFKERVSKINDPDMRSEVNRALAKLNPEQIDMAIFHLQRIFRHAIRRYMVDANIAGEEEVDDADMQDLETMLKWAERNRFIRDEEALNVLGSEQTKVAISPPNPEERQKLLAKASKLVPIYLDNIALFTNEAMKFEE